MKNCKINGNNENVFELLNGYGFIHFYSYTYTYVMGIKSTK